MALPMSGLRSLLRDHRRFALIVLALAFCLRAAIPTGHMIVSAGPMMISVSICADGSGTMKSTQIAIPAKDGAKLEKADKDTNCIFASLSKAMLGGADPFLIALAFAFILVLGLAPSRPRVTRKAPFTLPPLRGPPAFS